MAAGTTGLISSSVIRIGIAGLIGLEGTRPVLYHRKRVRAVFTGGVETIRNPSEVLGIGIIGFVALRLLVIKYDIDSHAFPSSGRIIKLRRGVRHSIVLRLKLELRLGIPHLISIGSRIDGIRFRISLHTGRAASAAPCSLDILGIVVPLNRLGLRTQLGLAINGSIVGTGRIVVNRRRGKSAVCVIDPKRIDNIQLVAIILTRSNIASIIQLDLNGGEQRHDGESA